MRLVTQEVPQEFRGKEHPPMARKKVRFGWEDIVLFLALLIILVSWVKGDFSPDRALAYLGFTATGGIWGYFSGRGSA